MVVQDESQIPALIELGQQWSEPAGEIGEDEDLTLLLVHLLQHCGIGLFETEAPHRESLPLEGASKYGARREPIGIVVVKDLNGLLRHLRDFLNGMVHRVDQGVRHDSP